MAGRSKWQILPGLIWLSTQSHQEGGYCLWLGLQRLSRLFRENFSFLLFRDLLQIDKIPICWSHPRQQHFPKCRKYLLYYNGVLRLFMLRRHWIKKQTTVKSTDWIQSLLRLYLVNLQMKGMSPPLPQGSRQGLFPSFSGRAASRLGHTQKTLT